MSNQEQTYTSTGAKLWHHREAMENYRAGDPRTIVSTHISPTGKCNLACPYCSVRNRKRNNVIPMETIVGYVDTLIGYGLKAVILTGGGEPLLYDNINELIQFLKFRRHLDVALITNGTQCAQLDAAYWGLFSWVRVSFNAAAFGKFNLAPEYINPACTVGASLIYAGEHKSPEFLRECATEATRIGAKYVRVLPDCMVDPDELREAHEEIDAALFDLGDKRFFHQHKYPATPSAMMCHQAYFRPYLSEVPYFGNDKPGSVYPCDSVVLNEKGGEFTHEYQICHADHVANWLGGRYRGPTPCEDCAGCVFSGTVDMLDDYLKTGEGTFTEGGAHANFI